MKHFQPGVEGRGEGGGRIPQFPLPLIARLLWSRHLERIFCSSVNHLFALIGGENIKNQINKSRELTQIVFSQLCDHKNRSQKKTEEDFLNIFLLHSAFSVFVRDSTF